MTCLHGFSQRKGNLQPLEQYVPSGKYGRMFPYLPPFRPDELKLEALGKAMILSSYASHHKDVDSTIPAGYTYLGQFIDHDITFDITPLQASSLDPEERKNFRTPMLDLDSLYGAGPIVQPYFYEFEDPALFIIGLTSGERETGENPNDLPRAPKSNIALIADPRNDENLIIAQLHLAFLKFHNKVVQEIKQGNIQRDPNKLTFEQARELVIHHYQWIILHDFLPRILDLDQLELVLKYGLSFYQPNESTFIPVEFSAAAYRLGHSMVRQQYNYNQIHNFAPLENLFALTTRSGDPEDYFRVPISNDWIIDWSRFFSLDSAIKTNEFNFSRKLDPFLVQYLAELPNVPKPKSLAVRNLLRGRSLGLPSGQCVAQIMGFEPLTEDEISQGSDGQVAREQNFHIETPLWYYILKEAQIRGEGNRLGQVGSRIVAEVFVGLLKADKSSFLSQDPEWKPMLTPKAKETCDFAMSDLLNFVN